MSPEESRRRPLAAALGVAVVILLASCGEYVLWHLRGVENEWRPILRATWLVAGGSAVLAGLLGTLLPRFAAVLIALIPAGALFAKTGTRLVGLTGNFAWVVAVVLAVAGAVVLARILKAKAVVAAAAGLAVVAFGVSWLQHRTTFPEKPEILDEGLPDMILIVLDTTRRDRLSLYGYQSDTTPELIDFARTAQVYDEAWGVAPWTPPSHATLFTGLLPAEHGVCGQGTSPSLPKGLITLPGLLAARGYRTGGFPANAILTAPGWDRDFHVYQQASFASKHTFIPWLNRYLRGKDEVERDDYKTVHMLERTKQWWKDSADGPRFAFINLMDAHRKYHPLDEDFERFLPGVSRAETDSIDAQFWERFDPVNYEHAFSDREYELMNLLYDAEIAGMDRELGRFFDWLGERGEFDDTIIVITSDHGERLGERGILGHKLSQDPYLLHVPLVVSWPARLEPGRIDRRVQIDGIPGYLLHLAGLQPPDHMADNALHKQDRRVVFAQFRYPQGVMDDLAKHIPDFDPSPYEGDWYFAADEDDFCYEWPRRETPAAGRLTDFQSDPEFERDVSAEHADRVARLRAVVESMPEFGEAQEYEPTPEMLEKLRALGYIR